MNSAPSSAMRNREQAQAIIDRMRGYERHVFANSRKNGEIDSALSDRFCEYAILSALGGYVSMLENGCAVGKKFRWTVVKIWRSS